MERCTGRFFRRMKITMPKPRPKTQNRSPIISKLCPFTPRNETEERSGSFKAASPPSSAGWAIAEPAVRSSRVASIAKVLVNRRPTDAKWAFQVRMKILLCIQFRGHDLSFFSGAFPPAAGFHPPRVRPPAKFEHAPNTLPPPGITIKRSADLAASENLCRLHGVRPQTPHLGTKHSFIASRRKAGQRRTSHCNVRFSNCASSHQIGLSESGHGSGLRLSGGFRIIDRQPCPPPWTRLSPPHASASPSADPGSRPRTYLGAGEIPAWARSRPPPPGTRRAGPDPRCG